MSSAPSVGAVQLELHPGHPDIVGGGGGQGHRARHGRAGGGPVRLTVGAVVSGVVDGDGHRRRGGGVAGGVAGYVRSACGCRWRPWWCSTTRCRASWCPRRQQLGAVQLNCTPATPTLSEAVAVRVTVPDTVAPAAGAVRLTVGAVVSGLLTVTVTDVEVVLLPAASLATAVSVWVPLLAVAVFHDTL